MELEQATRQMRIDPRLKAAGWAVTPFDPAMPKAIPSQKAVEEWPTTAGPADYALCDEHSGLFTDEGVEVVGASLPG
ncbi:helicase, type I site-specific restriction-modification system restriction subunit [Mycobacteroides abscessus subsp. abscessus]|nr:helicase, type I site-specific restriction-modification system restriction subunit [Mycobacteroides abscessus subsp. abscessus]